jgi:hypothetical protein
MADDRGLPTEPVDAWTHPCGCKDFIERTQHGVNTGRAFCARHANIKVSMRDGPEWPVLMLAYPHIRAPEAP